MSWVYEKSKRFMLDNGSHTIRFGTDLQPSRLLMNLVGQLRKTGQYLYDQDLEQVFDEQTIIHYLKPMVRGVLVNFDKEISIWEKLFNQSEEMSITMSYHPETPDQVLSRICEVMFEYFQFDAFCPLLSQQLISYYLQQKNRQIFQMIVESTHSATYIVPIFDNEIMTQMRRIDIGGKLLTNQLKEVISFKLFDFKHYYLLSNQIKEEMCFVSTNYKEEMKYPKNSFAKFFVLPDYEVKRKGYAVEKLDSASLEEKILLDKERITIPELLFNPSDIGLNQKGPVETIMDITKQLHPDISNYFLENVYLSGGNTFFQNYTTRFQQQLRQESPQNVNVNVQQLDNRNVVYEGGVQFNRSPEFKDKVITKKQYQEKGFSNLYLTYF